MGWVQTAYKGAEAWSCMGCSCIRVAELHLHAGTSMSSETAWYFPAVNGMAWQNWVQFWGMVLFCFRANPKSSLSIPNFPTVQRYGQKLSWFDVNKPRPLCCIHATEVEGTESHLSYYMCCHGPGEGPFTVRLQPSFHLSSWYSLIDMAAQPRAVCQIQPECHVDSPPFFS